MISRSIPRLLAVPAAIAIAVSAGGTAPAAGSTAGAYSWGANNLGQLGDGSTNPRVTAGMVRLPGIVAEVHGGREHAVALLSDHTVWAWGWNKFGQVGDGTNIKRSTPVRVLTNIVAVTTGHYSSMALGTDGTVWAWGRNDTGQLGDGTTVSRNLPVKVRGLPASGVTAIAAGRNHSLVLAAGVVYAWGSNAAGQLGTGSTAPQLGPVRVPGLSGVSAIAAGRDHTLAITSGGLYAWGENQYGQIGNGGAPTPSRRTGSPARPVSRRWPRALTTAWPSMAAGRCGPGGATTSARSVTAPRRTGVRRSGSPD